MTLSKILSDNLTFSEKEIQQLTQWRKKEQYEKFNNFILKREEEEKWWDLHPRTLETVVADIQDELKTITQVNYGRKFQESLEDLQEGLRTRKIFAPSHQLLLGGVDYLTFFEKTAMIHFRVKQIGQIVEAARTGKKLVIRYLEENPANAVMLFYIDHRELAGDIIAATKLNSKLRENNDSGNQKR